MAANDAEALGPLRITPGLRVLTREGRVWLRGDVASAAAAELLAGLPCLQRYTVDAAGRLFPRGCRVPVGLLPEGDWMLLPEWLAPAAPALRMPGVTPEPAAVAIVRDTEPREPRGLLTTLDAWLTYGETAPAVRLERWRFAIADDRRVLVLGTPLPPLPGTELVGTDQLLLPAGRWFAAGIVARLLPGVLELRDDDLALFHDDASWEAIPDDCLVPATRSAIRRSGQEALP